MNTLISTTILGFFCACSSQSPGGFGGTGNGSTTDSGNTDSGTGNGLPSADTVWEVPDRGFDLLASNGLLYASTQAGGAIWSYDPSTGVEDKLAWDLGDLQAIAMDNDEILAAFTDSHVEGWVATIEPPKGVEVIASATEDGVLFRRPAGLAYGDSGEVYVLDTKAEFIWKISSAGVASIFYEIGGVAIFFFDGALYLGGDQGVFEVDRGGAVLLDERPAYGLEVVSGNLVASNTSNFVFYVGGEQLATGDLGRPGAMANLNGTLYIMDTVTGDVSAVDFN